MSSGSTDIQVHTLRRKFDLAQSDLERAQIADQLLPRVTNSLKGQDQLEMLDRVGPVEPVGLAGRIDSLRAIAAAVCGLDIERHVTAAIEAADKASTADRASIYDRIGYAYHSLGDYQRAETFILESIRLARELADEHGVAHGASVLGYGALRRGDYDSALRYAEITYIAAREARSSYLVVWSLITQYDILSSLGRWEEARNVQRSFHAITSDRDMRQFGFAKTVHDCELLAIDGDFAGAIRRIETLGEIDEIGSRAQAVALLALFLAGLGDDDRARTEARRAYSLASLPIPNDDPNKFAREQSAGEASLVASFVLTLIGATYKGARALAARKNLSGHLGPFARMLEHAATTGIWEIPPGGVGTLRGTADVIDSVRRARARTKQVHEGPFGRLTPREIQVLTAVAAGGTNTEIARAHKVTVSAVERVLIRAYRKIGVRARREVAPKLAELELQAKA